MVDAMTQSDMVDAMTQSNMVDAMTLSDPVEYPRRQQEYTPMRPEVTCTQSAGMLYGLRRLHRRVVTAVTACLLLIGKSAAVDVAPGLPPANIPAEWAQATWKHWPAGPTDLAALIDACNDNQGNELFVDSSVDLATVAKVPAFHGTWWQAVAVLCDTFALRPLPADRLFATQASQAQPRSRSVGAPMTVISGGTLTLSRHDSPSLAQAWLPYQVPRIIPAGAAALIIANQASWELHPSPFTDQQPEQDDPNRIAPIWSILAWRLRLEPRFRVSHGAALQLQAQDARGHALPPALNHHQSEHSGPTEGDRAAAPFRRPQRFPLGLRDFQRELIEAQGFQAPNPELSHEQALWSLWSWPAAIEGTLLLEGHITWPEFTGFQRSWLVRRGTHAKPIDGEGVEIYVRDGQGTNVLIEIRLPKQTARPSVRLLRRNRQPLRSNIVEENHRLIRLETSVPSKDLFLLELSWLRQTGHQQSHILARIPSHSP
jgi:hypothetical protein